MGGGGSKPACFGIGCCSKSYHLDPKADKGAKWCANEGGHCSADDGGKAEIYYGWGLTWQRKTLAKGRSIKCGNGKMGCDPLPGTRKYCFKVQHLDPNQPVCCGGKWTITRKIDILGKKFTVSETEESQQFTNGDAAMAHISATAKAQIGKLGKDNGFSESIALTIVPVKGVAEEVYGQICEPKECSANSWDLGNNFEMPSLYQMDLYLVPIIAFFLLFLSCVQCWSLVKRCKRRVPKKYRAVKRIDYESEVGTDEAIPMK